MTSPEEYENNHGEDHGESGESPRVVIRDKRRIDPATGEPREVADASASATPSAAMPSATPQGSAGAEPDDLRRALAERTADLQRVSAEYANYRRRVDRDRLTSAELATASVVGALLPVLDNIDRAREHGDLNAAFAAVADELEGTLGKLGLSGFGEVGDPFDPKRHEAVAHSTSPDVDQPTCVEVMRRGYSFGERLLRPALVGVADRQLADSQPADSELAAPGPAVDASDE